MFLPSLLLSLSVALPLAPASASEGQPAPAPAVVFTDAGMSVVVPEDIELTFPAPIVAKAVSAEENAAREAAARARREAAELAARVKQLRDSGLVVSDSGWVRPLASGYRFTSGYGWRGAIPSAGVGAMFHNGIDLSAPAGTNLHAPFDGTITYSGWGRRGHTGWAVEVTHSNGTVVMYNHMLRQSPLTPGTSVRAGDVVGQIGSTGNSSGPHVHLTVWQGDSHVSPEDYFARHGISFR